MRGGPTLISVQHYITVINSLVTNPKLSACVGGVRKRKYADTPLRRLVVLRRYTVTTIAVFNPK